MGLCIGKGVNGIVVVALDVAATPPAGGGRMGAAVRATERKGRMASGEHVSKIGKTATTMLLHVVGVAWIGLWLLLLGAAYGLLPLGSQCSGRHAHLKRT
jgi:hypothetical protein